MRAFQKYAFLRGGGSGGSGSPPTPTDPYFANVVLLLGYEGSTGSTTITDESPVGRATETVTGAAITNVTTHFGGTLGLGGNNDWVRYADHADFSFGAGDFTVETFFRQAADHIGITDAIITKWNGTTQHEWAIFARANLIEFYWSTTGSNSLSVNYNPGYSGATFHHIAFSRVGNTGYLCFNGTIVATADLTGVTFFDSTARLTLGANNEGGSAYLTGHLDETRITKGVGRYSGSVSSSYTVPTEPFPRA